MPTNDPAALQTAATDDRIEYEYTRVPVTGGILVYHNSPDEIGRRLIGLEDVTNRSELRQALASRGHDVGAVHHLP